MTNAFAKDVEGIGSSSKAIGFSADIVAAYVSNNSLPAAELANLLLNVHQMVCRLANEKPDNLSRAESSDDVEKLTPVQIRRSITPDAIISFIDGKSYKTLKRHLGKHGLDPHAYRQRYGLPKDYPMVAPSYAAHRSALAKSNGLGRPGSLAAGDETSTSTSRRRKPSTQNAA